MTFHLTRVNKNHWCSPIYAEARIREENRYQNATFSVTCSVPVTILSGLKERVDIFKYSLTLIN